MKKLNLFSFVAIFALVGLGSCTDPLVTSTGETIDLLPKATISGYVTAEMNLQNSGNEYVPEGTQLLVEVNYSDINPSATGKWKDTITVNSNGKYTVSVPTDANGVVVTFSPIAFEADQLQPFGALTPTVKKTFSSIAITVSISSGQTQSKDIVYSANALPTYVEKVKVSGKCYANLNQETGGYEMAPNGTIITFYNSSWKDSAIIKDGVYSVLIPKSIIVSSKSKFTYSKRVWNQTSSTYSNLNYEFILSPLAPAASFTTATENYDFNAGEGTDLTISPIVSQAYVFAQAELDESTSGLENVPNGTVIKFYTTSNPVWGTTATVSNGRCVIYAPKYQTVYYTLSFNSPKKVAMIDPQTFNTVYVNVDYSFSTSGSTTFNNDNDSYSFSTGAGNDVNPMVTITGNALAEMDDTSAGMEKIPTNTQLKFYYPNSNGSFYSAYVTSTGTYSITIPKGRSVTCTGTFGANRKLGGTTVFKTYSISNMFTSDLTKTIDIVGLTN